MTWNHWDAWQEYRVTDVRTIEDFMLRYYKPDRYTGQGPEYAAILLRSHTMDLHTYGVDWISHHDSVTGRVVAFYGPLPTVLTPVEHVILTLLQRHPGGLRPRAIIDRTQINCRTWWEARDHLAAAGRIQPGPLPHPPGDFPWIATPPAKA